MRAAAPTGAARADGRVGVHLMLGDGRKQWRADVWAEHLDYAADLLGPRGYVVQMLQSDQMNPARWQFLLNLAAARSLRPIVRLATTFDHRRRTWRPPAPDPAGGRFRRLAERYARFLGALRWPPGERLIVVGNEPNRGDEWGNAPDPAAYARYLADVSAALRRRGFLVLNAPLDPFCPDTGAAAIDGVRYVDAGTFLDRALAADPDLLEGIDGWASHCYPLGPFAEAPERQEYRVDRLTGGPAGPVPPPGVFNRGVNGYRWELWKLRAAGLRRRLPVFITETGWRHAETQDPSPNDAVGATATSRAAGAHATRALFGPADPERGFVPLLEDPDVAAVVFFALDGDPRYWGHTNWLRLASTGRIVGVYPQYDLVRAALRERAS